MTDAELSSLEAAAKAATPGLWHNPGRCFVVARYAKDQPIVCDCLSNQFAQAPKDAKYIAAASPPKILELIAELRQARDACEEHDLYIGELEMSVQMYDHALATLAELLGVEHSVGWKPEIDILVNAVRVMRDELRQTLAERDWVIEQIISCHPCPSTVDKYVDDCDEPSCNDCWLKAAKDAVNND